MSCGSPCRFSSGPTRTHFPDRNRFDSSHLLPAAALILFLPLSSKWLAMRRRRGLNPRPTSRSRSRESKDPRANQFISFGCRRATQLETLDPHIPGSSIAYGTRAVPHFDKRRQSPAGFEHTRGFSQTCLSFARVPRLDGDHERATLQYTTDTAESHCRHLIGSS